MGLRGLGLRVKLSASGLGCRVEAYNFRDPGMVLGLRVSKLGKVRKKACLKIVGFVLKSPHHRGFWCSANLARILGHKLKQNYSPP